MFDQEQRRSDLDDSAKQGDDDRQEDEGHGNESQRRNAQIYAQGSDLGRYKGRGFQPRNVW